MSLYKECFGKLETIVNTKTGEIEKFEYLIRHKDFTPMELLHKIEQNNEKNKYAFKFFGSFSAGKCTKFTQYFTSN